MEDAAIRALVGWTKIINDLRKRIDRTARTELSVLILGERGTGKELIARALHEGSARAKHRFIAVNSAAFPRDLIESELFGYVRGAFTGADKDKRGKFELAHGGTLFLDEIGDLSLEGQGKLLRTLQSRQIDKLGAEEPVKVDVRIIAATNRDLEAMVKNDQFRADLHDRLSGCTIRTPALRHRLGDIPLLLQQFVQIHAEPRRLIVHGFSAELVQFFQRYSWPGNVRELEHIARFLLETVDDEIADIGDLPPEFLEKVKRSSVNSLGCVPKQPISRESYINALNATHQNRLKAARLLGISRSHLYRIKKKHGL
jgi:transcriptional regulator with PAS, ATPase and Fis domain